MRQETLALDEDERSEVVIKGGSRELFVASEYLPDLDSPILGEPSACEDAILTGPEDKLHKLGHVMKWILDDICRLQAVVDCNQVHPAVTSRSIQELFSGKAIFMQAYNISKVPFPFVFAQVMQFLMYIFYLVCPFLVTLSLMEFDGKAKMFTSMLLNFMTVVGFATLNEIAIEMEMPFGVDANDYQIDVMRWSNLRACEDALFVEHPLDFTLEHMGDGMRCAAEEACRAALAANPPATQPVMKGLHEVGLATGLLERELKHIEYARAEERRLSRRQLQGIYSALGKEAKERWGEVSRVRDSPRRLEKAQTPQEHQAALEEKLRDLGAAGEELLSRSTSLAQRITMRRCQS